jgi:hypothetical protein
VPLHPRVHRDGPEAGLQALLLSGSLIRYDRT